MGMRPSAVGRGLPDLAGRFAPLIFLGVMMLVFAVLEPRFLDPTNLFNVMRQISITGLIALGMTFVILTAGYRSLRRLGPGARRHRRRRGCEGLHRQLVVA